MPDREIGTVELTATTRIIFAVGSWKGQSRGSIRKFVATEKYAGPTKAGMSLDGPTVVQLLGSLRALQSTVPNKDSNHYISVAKTRDWEIRIALIPPDEKGDLPSVDIREFVETPRYTGPTKAGVRFPWNKLKQFIQLVEVLVRQLGSAASAEATLFPEIQPKWISDAKESLGTTAPKSALHGFDASTLKSFPTAFLPDEKFEVENVKLPSEPLKIGQDRSGHQFVTDGSTFRRDVRNEVEGKFFIYAHQRGVIEVSLPSAMFKIFSTVVGYEKYCRELRQKLIRDFEAQSHNRALAEHMVRDLFESHGLPIC